MNYHPAANIFPMLSNAEFAALVEDIRANGLRESIKLCGGSIIDGRNRYRACIEADVEPRFEDYGGSDPIRYVVSLNLHRRHLTESQRAMVAAVIANLSDGQRADRSANLPTLLPEADRPEPVTQAEAAELLNVSERTVRAARKVQNEGAPELVAAVQAGEVSVSAAADVATLPVEEQVEIVARGEREILEAAKAIRAEKAKINAEERAKVREQALSIAPPSGLYRTIVIDPPWPMEKVERDVRPNQAGFEYPTMSEEELAALDIPAAAECHLYMWTTQKFLPMAFRLMDRWGFPYMFTMVWHKPGGFQPIGLPQYNCEFVLFGRRGGLAFNDTKAFPTCFNAPRREHSRKPDEFYDLVRRVSPGPRIDMFSRETRDGFDTWGAEAAKFDGAAA